MPCPCFVPGSLAGAGSALPPAEGDRQPHRAPRSCIIHRQQTPACPAAFHRSFLALLLLPVTRTLKRSFWKPAKGHWPGSCPLCSGKLSRENKRVWKTVANFKLLIMANMALRTQDSSKSFLWLIYKLLSAVDFPDQKHFPTSHGSQSTLPVWQCTRREQEMVTQCLCHLYRGSGLDSGQLYIKKKQATRRACWCIKWAKEPFDS